MPVSIPTAADVRKAREQAARAAAGRAEVARTPALAFLGAGDLAVRRVSRVVADVRTQAGDVQDRVAGLPQRLRRSELRRTYSDFAERGELAWGRIRTQPQVKQVISTIESVTERLDARVDGFVDDAHDAAEKALRVVSWQTRATGEKVARVTRDATAGAAATVSDAAAVLAEVAVDASESVSEAGDELAATITEAGDEAARETRSTARRAANRAAPKPASAMTATSTVTPVTRRAKGTTPTS